MATLKKRIHISVPTAVEDALLFLSKRDNVPQATKVTELLTLALEIEEDTFFSQVVSERMKKKAKWMSHTSAWNTR
jgi:predicted DNA-binding protein